MNTQIKFIAIQTTILICHIQWLIHWSIKIEITHWGRDKMAAIFKCFFLSENVWISLKISLKFIPKGPINNMPALVQIMAWHRPGDKPLSEPMVVGLLTHICVTRPQCVNIRSRNISYIYSKRSDKPSRVYGPQNWYTYAIYMIICMITKQNGTHVIRHLLMR